MTKTASPQIRLEDVAVGSVVRFRTSGYRNRITLYVTDGYRFGAIGGYRAIVEEGSATVTRGEVHYYHGRADLPVEVLRPAPQS